MKTDGNIGKSIAYPLRGVPDCRNHIYSVFCMIRPPANGGFLFYAGGGCLPVKNKVGSRFQKRVGRNARPGKESKPASLKLPACGKSILIVMVRTVYYNEQ
ncbi:hypothetical protein [Bacillus sp. REN3]|uniref:hypothetical protein n=1 Tax=Bacillus sp. REN3 TaxID=2802440 RepID=UPI001AED6570|nr:hypothetical protein [Bacillus sp. REN3]